MQVDDLDFVSPRMAVRVVQSRESTGVSESRALCPPVRPTLDRTTNSSLGRHDVGFCDYFLSHKKHHTKLGGIPEQIAKNMHDALEMLGHIGFFDVDDLDAISKENLETCIGQCLSMIVFMNNETMKSEWCTFEWEVAHRIGIPIKVVVDVTNCVKQDILKMVQDSPWSFLLQSQWLEYSDSTRRLVIQQMSRWVSQETGRAVDIHSSKNVKAILSANGVLCIRDGESTVPLFHPLFEKFMAFCGLVYNANAWSLRVLFWVKVVRCMTVACFAICLWRLVYASGPSYTDWYSCLYVTIIHVFLYHALVCLTGFLTSRLMVDVLRHLANSALLVWTTRRVNIISKWSAVMGILAGCTCAVVMNVIYLPLFLSEEYMSTAHGMAFGISSTTFFLSVAPFVLIQEFAVLTLLFITLVLLRHSFECSVCCLHELIPCVGLETFVESGLTSMAPTESQLNQFSDGWSKALSLQLRTQRFANQVLYVHFVCNLGGILIPCVYLYYGEEFLQPGAPWQKWAKPMFWWVFASVWYLATIFLPAYSDYGLQKVVSNCRCLNMPMKANQFMMTLLQADLSWRMGPVRMTAFGALWLALPLWVSGACWVMIGSMAMV